VYKKLLVLAQSKGSCVFTTSEFPSEIPRAQTRNYPYTKPLQTITRKSNRTEFCRILRWKNSLEIWIELCGIFTRLLNFTQSEFSQFMKTELCAESSRFAELSLKRNSIKCGLKKNVLRNLLGFEQF